jgi:hypothetical protein
VKDWIDGFLSPSELEIKYKCPYYSMKTQAKKLKITRKTLNEKLDKEKLLIEYQKGKSIAQLSKENDISKSYLENIFKNIDIYLRSPSERCCKLGKDETYFDFLDNQDKLYILGLLFADGYNSETRHTIKLSLKEEDMYILEKINKLLKSERNIKYTLNKKYMKYYPALVISNKKLSDRLRDLGVVQNKSLILKYPSFIENNEMLRHFLRGYIDGDGYIGYNTANKKCKVSIDIKGTYDLLSNIQNKLIDIFSISKTKIKMIGNIYEFKISQRYKIELILDWIYKDANLYLSRKYEKYIMIKEINRNNPMKKKPPKNYNFLDKVKI